MKKINLILIIALAVCICIIALLSFLLFTNNSNNKSITGIYQTQYINANASWEITLRINEDGKCKISDSRTGYGNDYTWKQTENGIIITDITGKSNMAEILSNGDLFFANHHYKKLK